MRHLTLFLPQLGYETTSVESTVTHSFPTLESLLAYGQPAATPFPDFTAQYFAAFGLSPLKPYSVAPLTALAEGVKGGQRFWLRADPVHLRADHSTVYWQERVDLSVEEATALQDFLNVFLIQDGLKLQLGNAKGWYLNLPENPGLLTRDPERCRGISISDYLIGQGEAPRWRQLFTELQMLLYDCPVNQQRRDQGKTTAEGLWFWGGGCLPEKQSIPLGIEVGGEDLLLKGLAQWAGVPWNIAKNFEEYLEIMNKNSANHYWLTARGCSTEDLESQWFVPLQTAWQSNYFSSIDLYFGNHTFCAINSSLYSKCQKVLSYIRKPKKVIFL